MSDNNNKTQQPLSALGTSSEGVSVASESYSANDNNYNNDDGTATMSSSRRPSNLYGARQTLARKETRAVMMLRSLIFVILLMALVAVSWAVYKYLQRAQTEDFNVAFIAAASKIVENFSQGIQRELSALDSLSSFITSFAVATNQSFPFITVPHFEFHGSASRVLSEGLIVQWFPLVTEDNRAAWEDYANHTYPKLVQAIMSESKQRTLQDQRLQLDVSYESTATTGNLNNILNQYNPKIYAVNEALQQVPEPEGVGPYLPVWQSSPAAPILNLVNLNVLRQYNSFKFAVQSVVDTYLPVMSEVIDLYDPKQGGGAKQRGVYDLYLATGQFRAEPGREQDFAGDPSSGFGYPVFTDFPTTNDHTNRTLAGVVSVNLNWRLHFQDILPDNAVGILVVIQNTKNQTFTYRIDGPIATFLGPGDRHDPAYDDTVYKIDNVIQTLYQQVDPTTQSYTGLSLNADYCEYSLQIYPAKDFEVIYIDDSPFFSTVVVICIFIFTSCVFVMYDCLVQRRQTIVMDQAVASGAIVSSLFPESVREQLIQETKQAEKQPDSKRGVVKNNQSHQQESAALSGIDTNQAGNKCDNNEHSTAAIDSSYGENSNNEALFVLTDSKPLADLYAHCTILFADLAGFTSWSAKRSPDEVFRLLETLYGEFDKIAQRRNVFKVETIGDCYLAATGLPEPQPNHAVIMSKFAHECMIKMKQIINNPSFQKVLGGTDDTSKLQFRVGMHSGAVTAGVLRGQKSRFQLFGDTVNTASRMESNGVPGKIHVSQDTADALVLQGKPKWLIPRKDKIVAKGKGELQTYFVEIKSETTTSSAPSSQSRLSFGI